MSHAVGGETPRFDSIDLLRGLSILAVVLLHAQISLALHGYPVGSSLPAWLRYAVFSNGGNGVSTFFAISGFLITYVSIRRFGSLGQMAPTRFYRLRFARIAPPLLVLLFTLSVLHLTNAPRSHIRPEVGSLPQALFAALTFQLNWFEAVHGWLPPAWTVLWSLSVEEMFYLFFPLLCLLLMNRRRTQPIFIAILLGLALFGPFARTPWYTTNYIWSYQSYLGNMDNVALGCLTAMLCLRLDQASRFLKSQWPLILEIAGAILMLFIVFWEPRVILGWHIKQHLARTGTDVTVLGIGACLVMLGSVLRQRTGGRWLAPIRWLGQHSYEIYLTHEFALVAVFYAFFRIRRGPIALWIGAAILLASGLGFLMTRLVSEPMNRALRGAPVIQKAKSAKPA
jgi:peptidoglycan/LPS O-acetylase OafA/YrhL